MNVGTFRPFASILGIALVAALTSCSHEQGVIKDARAEAAVGAAQRLQGKWTLVAYQPDVPLETALQLLLNAQLGHLVVEFNGNNLTAQGPGVTINRAYKIDEAYENHFKATVIDPYGVGIESSCDFSGNQLVANGMNAPWRGRATFNKTP
jgi:hypothetical protein